MLNSRAALAKTLRDAEWNDLSSMMMLIHYENEDDYEAVQRGIKSVVFDFQPVDCLTSIKLYSSETAHQLRRFIDIIHLVRSDARCKKLSELISKAETLQTLDLLDEQVLACGRPSLVQQFIEKGQKLYASEEEMSENACDMPGCFHP